MPSKIVRFSLIKENISFTEKQKDDIKSVIQTYNWDNFKDLISVEFYDIGNDYFEIKVQDTGHAWFSNFSQVVCNKAILVGLRVIKHDNYRLFDAKEQVIK
ncbi:hypothetical protein [Fictibacillus terranigra]|uniref:Uncharacterized protein n=1 Tax=Fictibacillus terranigra TaxID=3058424 RepID=A0ABT8E598_9BACL|nr:hypothetical protein [Fictibacillus sp. CENA-BCM004]MDN4073070.1 hypothetical protein [Fictibacillus sp. CENA-BCM004]